MGIKNLKYKNQGDLLVVKIKYMMDLFHII